jgi:transposase
MLSAFYLLRLRCLGSMDTWIHCWSRWDRERSLACLDPQTIQHGRQDPFGPELSKHGDRYLRTLLVHGAHSMLLLNWKKSDRKRRWAEALKMRKPWNKVAVALADKHARILWVMLARGETYHPSRATLAPSEAPA